ncbi:MAG TPA: hypothetical protein VIW68_10895 [Candidatus Sulfotelmatobacter sp.]
MRQIPAFKATENLAITLRSTKNAAAKRLASATSPLMAALASAPLTILPGSAKYANTGADNNKSIARSPAKNALRPKNTKSRGIERLSFVCAFVGVTASLSTLEIRNIPVIGTATTTPRYSADTPKPKPATVHPTTDNTANAGINLPVLRMAENNSFSGFTV